MNDAPISMTTATAPAPVPSAGRLRRFLIPRSSEFRRKAVVATYTIATLVFMALALHRVWHVFNPFDDAYISFRYADNLLRGQGLVYNPGEPVEGYTNFLWVLMTAAGMGLGFDPIEVTLALSKFAFVACVPLCTLLIRRGWAGRWSDLLGIAPLAWLVFASDFEKIASSGLETVWFGALILALGVVEFHWKSEGTRWRWWHGLLPTAIIWTRPDGGIFVASLMGCYFFWKLWASHSSLSFLRALGTTMLATLRRYGLALVLVGGHLLWKLAYYGSLIPNTAYAKRVDEFQWKSGLAYIRGFLDSYPHMLIVIVLLILAVFSPPTPRSKAMVISLGMGLAGFVTYLAKVGGDFMHYRFAFEVVPLMVGLAGLGLLTLAKHSFLAPAGITVFAFSLGFGHVKEENEFGMQTIADMARYVREGQRAGAVLAETTPPDIILSSTLAGTIAYYSNRVVIDQWGLNDRHVARLSGGSIRGHMKSAPVEYLRERGVNIKVTHPHFTHCSHGPKDKEAILLLKLDNNQCLRTEYLVQTPELTKWFCDRPENFILMGVSCDSKRTRSSKH